MGAGVDLNTINYRDQASFDAFFSMIFDKYDYNKDGYISFNEYQSLIHEMCELMIQTYGNGPIIDRIRNTWYVMDVNRNGFIERQEFCTRAKFELEMILGQPQYTPHIYHASPGIQHTNGFYDRGNYGYGRGGGGPGGYYHPRY